MPIQPQATRSLRRVKIRTPGNRLVIHYLKRKPSVAKCAKCKKELKGMPREFPSVFRNLPLSQKRVTRAFGGNMCSKCSREALTSKFDFKEVPLEIGQLCVKIAGRESGNICVVVDKVDNNFVLIDGQVKRRKCNILHLKTLDKKIDIKKNESTENIKKEFKKLGYEIREKKLKSQKTQEKIPVKNLKEEKPEKKLEPKQKKELKEKKISKKQDKVKEAKVKTKK